MAPFTLTTIKSPCKILGVKPGICTQELIFWSKNWNLPTSMIMQCFNVQCMIFHFRSNIDTTNTTKSFENTAQTTCEDSKLPRHPGPPVGLSHSSLDLLNRKHNFGYVPKPQTKPGAIKPMVYRRGYGSARQLASNTTGSMDSINPNPDYVNSTMLKEEKDRPITTVKGVQRAIEMPKLVNPFLDENLISEAVCQNRKSNLSSSDDYWHQVTKDVGYKTVSQQQLNASDASTQTIRKKRESCNLM